ncbi:helix-turn-helix domain-containing protein [Thermomonospora amylolytica]|uniref:helix-turn-helix domain-containing protein n=1 Tax=Thermomonospora amylolytica TaxID=1411117 RepID=UPI00130032EF|nr:helix-turn-helix transcriptional regulator [Thermomonospora amylolytica]
MGTNADDPRLLGRRLAEERESRGWSKREMARRLFAADDRPYPSTETLLSYVKRWEAGKGGISRRYRTAYARVFEMDETELFGSHGTEAQAAEMTVDLLGAAWPHRDGRPADAAYVESVRQTSQALVRLDTVHGAEDLLPLALRAFREAHRKLAAGAHEPATERDLMAATGEAGEVTAWLAYDADRQAVSRQVIQEALLLSRQAGDRDMELFELTHLAMQSVHMHRPGEALRLVTGLLDAGRLTPRVAAILDIRRGRALAQLGDERAAMSALDKARATIGDGIGPRDPYWTWWVNDAEVIWHMAMARAQLGDWPGAVPLFHESAAHRTAYRRAHYNDLAHLLNAFAHVADWPETETLIPQLITLAGEIRSTRTTNLLSRTTARIINADPPSTVADLATHLHNALPAATST